MAKPKSPSKRTKRTTNPANEFEAVTVAAPTDGEAVLSPSVEATAPKTVEEAAPKADGAARKIDGKADGKKSDSRGTVVPINLEDEIRRRAYELAEERGFQGGSETEDWLRAEREVLQRYRQHSA